MTAAGILQNAGFFSVFICTADRAAISFRPRRRFRQASASNRTADRAGHQLPTALPFPAGIGFRPHCRPCRTSVSDRYGLGGLYGLLHQRPDHVIQTVL